MATIHLHKIMDSHQPLGWSELTWNILSPGAEYANWIGKIMGIGIPSVVLSGLVVCFFVFKNHVYLQSVTCQSSICDARCSYDFPELSANWWQRPLSHVVMFANNIILELWKSFGSFWTDYSQDQGFIVHHAYKLTRAESYLFESQNLCYTAPVNITWWSDLAKKGHSSSVKSNTGSWVSSHDN